MSTPNLNKLADPVPGWPEPDEETKRNAEALLVDLLPLLPAGYLPLVGAGSDAGHRIELWWGDRELAFYVLFGSVSYNKSDDPDVGTEWESVEGRVPADTLRSLVAWLMGGAC